MALSRLMEPVPQVPRVVSYKEQTGLEVVV